MMNTIFPITSRKISERVLVILYFGAVVWDSEEANDFIDLKMHT